MFLDVGQLPKEVQHWLENVSSESRKKPLFIEQLPDAGHRRRDEYICVCERERAYVCFLMCMPLLYHIVAKQNLSISLMKQVKKSAFLQVDIGIGSLLIDNLIFFPAIFLGKMFYMWCVCCCCFILSAFLWISIDFWKTFISKRYKRISCISVQPHRRWKADLLLQCFWFWLYYLPP